MGRGDIFLVDLDPVVGSEANQSRPAVLVSNDGANEAATRLGRGVVTVVPITSNVERVYVFQVLLPAPESGLDRDSKAQAEQVKSVSVKRIGARLGTLSAPLMLELDEALRLHLALQPAASVDRTEQGVQRLRPQPVSGQQATRSWSGATDRHATVRFDGSPRYVGSLLVPVPHGPDHA